MIDTIILSIQREHFTPISNPLSSNWELYSKNENFEKYVKNQTHQQKNDGVYRPRISVIKRGGLSFLRIEFSIPKLIFGNNVDEVCENDFNNIIKTLQIRLKDFGVLISTKQLKIASVSVFHPSKNILLSDGYTANGVIKELKKINLTTRMDLNRDSFRNNGQSLQCYTGSHSLVIYDKVSDLKKRRKRAIDKDQTLIQSPLYHSLISSKIPTEILRIEVRLTKKQKMNLVLEKIGFAKNPTFEEVFKETICQKIVNQYWNDLVADKNIFLFSLVSNPKQILSRIFQENTKIKPKEAVYLIGIHQLCKDEDGIRELRALLEKHSKRTWYRIADDIKKLNSIQNSTLSHSWVKQVTTQIQTFSPLKINLDM